MSQVKSEENITIESIRQTTQTNFQPTSLNKIIDYSKLPDTDSYKMFLTQIPRELLESDLRKILEKFGPLSELTPLHENLTNDSRGSCFVHYQHKEDSEKALRTLHNKVVLPPNTVPLQLRISDTDPRKQDRKLFVGMILNTLQEDDLKAMFKNFGEIEDVTVLRNDEGKSRCCAFIQYATRESAQDAIDEVHQSITMHGCSAPINVRFAEQPKKHSLQLDRMQTDKSLYFAPNDGERKGRYSFDNSDFNADIYQSSRLSSFKKTLFDTIQEKDLRGQNGASEKQQIGPKNSNIFLYHLPNYYTDQDIYLLCKEFGNVVSAKVYIDKITKQTKCFGFASFSEPAQAARAVRALDGKELRVDIMSKVTRKLKVGLKDDKRL